MCRQLNGAQLKSRSSALGRQIVAHEKLGVETFVQTGILHFKRIIEL
jgi:hypothetical protein